MVRLAFHRSYLSIYYYVYLLLPSSFLALSAKCTIFFVCALHEHAVHPLGSLRKISKIQINFSKAKEWVVIFPEGVSPLHARVIPGSVSKSQGGLP